MRIFGTSASKSLLVSLLCVVACCSMLHCVIIVLHSAYLWHRCREELLGLATATHLGIEALKERHTTLALRV